MNELTKINDQDFARIEDSTSKFDKNDLMVISQAANNIVGNVTNCVNNLAASYSQIMALSAQVEMETNRLEYALDCLKLKVQTNLKIYEDTLPLLEKNFSSMQDRMDRLVDRAMDILTEDTSADALNRQMAIMQLIEMTNNSINSLVSRLMPNY